MTTLFEGSYLIASVAHPNHYLVQASDVNNANVQASNGAMHCWQLKFLPHQTGGAYTLRAIPSPTADNLSLSRDGKGYLALVDATSARVTAAVAEVGLELVSAGVYVIHCKDPNGSTQVATVGNGTATTVVDVMATTKSDSNTSQQWRFTKVTT